MLTRNKKNRVLISQNFNGDKAVWVEKFQLVYKFTCAYGNKDVQFTTCIFISFIAHFSREPDKLSCSFIKFTTFWIAVINWWNKVQVKVELWYVCLIRAPSADHLPQKIRICTYASSQRNARNLISSNADEATWDSYTNAWQVLNKNTKEDNTKYGFNKNTFIYTNKNL